MDFAFRQVNKVASMANVTDVRGGIDLDEVDYDIHQPGLAPAFLALQQIDDEDMPQTPPPPPPPPPQQQQTPPPPPQQQQQQTPPPAPAPAAQQGVAKFKAGRTTALIFVQSGLRKNVMTNCFIGSKLAGAAENRPLASSIVRRTDPVTGVGGQITLNILDCARFRTALVRTHEEAWNTEDQSFADHIRDEKIKHINLVRIAHELKNRGKQNFYLPGRAALGVAWNQSKKGLEDGGLQKRKAEEPLHGSSNAKRTKTEHGAMQPAYCTEWADPDYEYTYTADARFVGGIATVHEQQRQDLTVCQDLAAWSIVRVLEKCINYNPMGRHLDTSPLATHVRDSLQRFHVPHACSRFIVHMLITFMEAAHVSLDKEVLANGVWDVVRKHALATPWSWSTRIVRAVENQMELEQAVLENSMLEQKAWVQLQQYSEPPMDEAACASFCAWAKEESQRVAWDALAQ